MPFTLSTRSRRPDGTWGQLEHLVGEAWLGVTWQVSRDCRVSYVARYQTREIEEGSGETSSGQGSSSAEIGERRLGMLPNVERVTQTAPYRLRLRFDDGAEGEIDVKEMISFVGVFEPLRDPEYFSRVRVDPEVGTIVWPNGADLDPLVLHSRVTGVPITLDVPTAQAG